MKYLLLYLLLLASSCVATKADLQAALAQMRGDIDAGYATEEDMEGALANVIEKIDNREATVGEWVETGLSVLALLGLPVTGVVVNRMRDGKRKKRGEPVAIKP